MGSTRGFGLQGAGGRRRAWVAVVGMLAGLSALAVAGAPSPAAAAEPGPIFVQIAAGGFTCGISDAGGIYCWGPDSAGELGNGPSITGDQSTPMLIDSPNGADWAEVAVGSQHACAVTVEGEGYCWGHNGSQRLGGGSANATEPSPIPVVTPPGVAWAHISPGGDRTCGVTTAGELYCWGLVSASPVATPTLFPGGPWASVSSGIAFSCGVTTTGAGFCWGEDHFGKLGNGPAIVGRQQDPSPVDTPAGVSWASISAGGQHTCGLTTAGAAYCWGHEANGGLGNGVATLGGQQLSPVPVSTPAGLVWSSLDAFGSPGACALTTAGKAYCWGTDTNELQGNGPGVNDQLVPAPLLVPADATFSTITGAGSGHCAITTTGTTYCWGYNANGQVGIGVRGAPVATPTVVGEPQTVSFGPLAYGTLGDAPRSLVATASSGLAVTFEAGGPCSVAGSTLSLTGVGTCTVTARQLGGPGWAASPPVVQTFTIVHPDTDGDDVNDPMDNCPTVPNGDQLNTDGDLDGNACDTDDDGDGVLDVNDAFPTNAGESVDTDGDGIGNVADPDDDGDGILDEKDAFPLQKDGLVSGPLSRQIKAIPSLASLLSTVRSLILPLGL